MKTIAIRGYMGSGKTTVANFIHDTLNYNVFNCDNFVSYLYAENECVIKHVNNILGKASDEKISKIELRKFIMEKEGNLEKLENIVFPLIEKEISRLKNENELLFLDCPTIDKIAVTFDQELYIQCQKENLVARVRKRDRKSVKDIEFLLKKQKKNNPHQKSYIIENNSTVQSLYEKINIYIEKELIY